MGYRTVPTDGSRNGVEPARPRASRTVCHWDTPGFRTRSILNTLAYRLGFGHDAATDKLAAVNRTTKHSAPLLPYDLSRMGRHPSPSLRKIVLPIRGAGNDPA